MCLKLERIANLIQCNVRRGHLAAVYTSGLRSTSVGHKNKLLGCPTQVLQWILGVSPCVKLVQKR
ncbi:hypothetical protein AB205_0220540 [Aquarana catesbeiana]|uniref:Uncharacterized protein n=1 Tax=Aquarana catesbeiana TaxID=8400 RepID=A0A2G9SLZ1_AQUCT|nr:hypothetical protein AB205_0220540 [Aquarana catesbeiana]